MVKMRTAKNHGFFVGIRVLSIVKICEGKIIPPLEPNIDDIWFDCIIEFACKHYSANGEAQQTRRSHVIIDSDLKQCLGVKWGGIEAVPRPNGEVVSYFEIHEKS